MMFEKYFASKCAIRNAKLRVVKWHCGSLMTQCTMRSGTMQALCNLMANLEISMSMGRAHYVVCMLVDW